METEKLYCIHCGKEEEYTTSGAPPHVKATCKVCGIYIKFLPCTSIDKFKMPFGKYKLRPILEVAKLDEEYLEWLFNQDNIGQTFKDRIVKAISIVKAQEKLDFPFSN